MIFVVQKVLKMDKGLESVKQMLKDGVTYINKVVSLSKKVKQNHKNKLTTIKSSR